jgi:hypothetical protein
MVHLSVAAARAAAGHQAHQQLTPAATAGLATAAAPRGTTRPPSPEQAGSAA